MERYEVLASAVFTAKSGNEVYTITVELVPHGGFDYGNCHSLTYNMQDANTGRRFMEQVFDARYDSRFNTVDSFNKYVAEFVRDQIRDDFTLERVN